MITLDTTQRPGDASALLIPPGLSRGIETIAARIAAAEQPEKAGLKTADRLLLRYETCFTRLYFSFVYACEQFAVFYADHGPHISINRHKKDQILGRYIKTTAVKSLQDGIPLINDRTTEICFSYNFSLSNSPAISRSFQFKSTVNISFDASNYLIEAENCHIKKPFFQQLTDAEIMNIVQSISEMHQKTMLAAIRPVECI